jgi:hypothetical protein
MSIPPPATFESEDQGRNSAALENTFFSFYSSEIKESKRREEENTLERFVFQINNAWVILFQVVDMKDCISTSKPKNIYFSCQIK